MDEAERQQVIRTKIAAGDLPAKPPVKMYAGPGTGQSCEACGVVIGADTTEYEFDVDGRVVRMHRTCFDAWTKQLPESA